MGNIKLKALSVYDDRYIKTKIRTYGDKVYLNFCDLNSSIHDISKSEAIHLLKILCLIIVDIYKSISNKPTLINIKNEFTTITLTIWFKQKC